MALNNLPPSWTTAKLGDVCDILDTFRKPINSDEREKRIYGKNKDRLFPYYGATGQVGWIDNYLLEGEYVLLGEDGAPFLELNKAKSYLVKGKIWVNNHAHVLKSHFSNSFLNYSLNSLDYSKYVTGTTRLKLNQSAMKNIDLLLPPLPEQHRIVAKLEELFTELALAVESLKKAKEQMKLYKQAVLASAFSGRLGMQNDEAGMQNVECKMQNEETGLPEGWKWVKVSNVAEINPKLPNKELLKPELEVQFLPMKLVEEIINKIHLTELKKLSEVNKGSYTPFIDSDIIFAKVTPCMENGKIAVVSGLKNSIGFGSSEFHVVRCSKIILNKFLFFYLIQEKYRSEAKNAMTGAVGLRRVPRQFIENTEFPLPPILEQKQIVFEIETRFSEAENLEKTIDLGLEQAESLRQSILKKAFEGRLVPQDPEDEPASLLLERIKREKGK